MNTQTRQQASDDFERARARAINRYADYERHLAILFETLLGADPQKSFTVFASVLNARARTRMIRRLLEQTYGDQFDTFFSSLTRLLESLDSTRNRIVHWIVLGQSSGGRPFDPGKDIFLSEHPDIFTNRKMYKDEIVEFTKKAEFFRLLVFYFAMYLKFDHNEVAPDKKPWREVFQEKARYPPEQDHPLFGCPVPHSYGEIGR